MSCPMPYIHAVTFWPYNKDLHMINYFSSNQEQPWGKYSDFSHLLFFGSQYKAVLKHTSHITFG